MSHRIAEPPVEHDAPPDLPAIPPVTAAMNSRRGAALVAGVGILLLAALAAFGNLVVVEGLVTDEDAARTARDVVAAEGTFRIGIASLYAAAALDVLVAWALFQVFRPVHEGLSRLAAWFRLAYGAVFLVAISQLAGMPDLLSSRTGAVFTPQQVDAMALAKAETFTDIYIAALLLFGLHLLLLGYLTYSSRQMPRLLGVLLAVAGLGYVFDTMAAVLTKGSPIVISTFTFLGEFLLAVWLVVRSRRLSQDPAPAPAGRTS
jgi:hypothetical protein